MFDPDDDRTTNYDKHSFNSHSVRPSMRNDFTSSLVQSVIPTGVTDASRPELEIEIGSENEHESSAEFEFNK